MPHWLIKSAIQRAISILPASQKFNELFQKYVTKSVVMGTGDFEFKLEMCRKCLDDFFLTNPSRPENFTALELGTGWYATVPIGFFLCGASEVWSFDIVSLMDRERLQRILNFFLDYDRAGKLQTFLPRAKPERIAKLRQLIEELPDKSPTEFLEKLNIHLVIRDAQNTGLPAKSIDLFFSCVVLAHIPQPVLNNIHKEYFRLATDNAAVIDYLNLKDQFQSFDRSITPLNYLQYSGAAWRWLDSPLIPQNRLRVSDYREMLRSNGFKILKEENKSAPLDTLEKIRLAPEFADYAAEDLLVIQAWRVAVKKAA